MKFIKNLSVVVLGFFIAFLLLFVFVIGISAAVNSGGKDQVKLDESTVLNIDMSQQFVDYKPTQNNPFGELIQIDDPVVQIADIVQAIAAAKNENKIKAVVLDLKNMAVGFSHLKEIRAALSDFKDSKKPIYAFADSYSQAAYYLASVSDRVYLHPLGAVDWKGFKTEQLFFKSFEDQYGIKMEVVRHGKFKSAGEPFLADKMSEANRKQMQALISSLWNHFSVDVAKSRNLSEESLNMIATNLSSRTAKMSLDNKLVDELAYRDEFEADVEEIAAVEEVNYLNVSDYMKIIPKTPVDLSAGKIAVLYAQGEIIYGEGDEKKIGQGLFMETINKLKDDKKVKAVVLRVNSPGGSAVASDKIWRTLELLKKEKPLVVSMGDYAASGGYYIACGADYIVAEPSTVTGSIGVFGAFPNVNGFVERIGINADQVKTHNNVDYSLFEKMTPEFYKLTQESIDQIYEVFLDRVSSGRSMEKEAVHEVAQGRVWTGSDALNIGLVDELGGIQVAIDKAAELAQLDTYRLLSYPKVEKDLEAILQSIPIIKSSIDSYKNIWMGEALKPVINQAKAFENMSGLQMRLPIQIQLN